MISLVWPDSAGSNRASGWQAELNGAIGAAGKKKLVRPTKASIDTRPRVQRHRPRAPEYLKIGHDNNSPSAVPATMWSDRTAAAEICRLAQDGHGSSLHIERMLEPQERPAGHVVNDRVDLGPVDAMSGQLIRQDRRQIGGVLAQRPAAAANGGQQLHEDRVSFA